MLTLIRRRLFLAGGFAFFALIGRAVSPLVSSVRTAPPYSGMVIMMVWVPVGVVEYVDVSFGWCGPVLHIPVKGMPM